MSKHTASTHFLVECDSCEKSHTKAKRQGRVIRCKCGAQFVPPPTAEQVRLRRLQEDCGCMARWAPHYQGRAQDLQRSRRPVASDNRSEAEIEADTYRAEQSRARARGLFVKLERLRNEAVLCEGQELRRAVAVIDWLIARGGAELTKGYVVREVVRAQKLSVLVGRAFADLRTKQRTDEGVGVLLELHGTELLRDAAQVWAEGEE